MKNQNKKGFTIVELVIVIAIIAILAAVLIPTFSNVIKNANESSAIQAVTAAYHDALSNALKDGQIQKSHTTDGNEITNTPPEGTIRGELVSIGDAPAQGATNTNYFRFVIVPDSDGGVSSVYLLAAPDKYSDYYGKTGEGAKNLTYANGSWTIK